MDLPSAVAVVTVRLFPRARAVVEAEIAICTPLYPYEVMMQGIPNFLPRGHGTYIYRREIVPATQTDCQYCLYYHGGKCSLEECPFLELKIANGTATIRQVMTSVFSAVTYPPFVGRLKRYIRESVNIPLQTVHHDRTN